LRIGHNLQESRLSLTDPTPVDAVDVGVNNLLIIESISTSYFVPLQKRIGSR